MQEFLKRFQRDTQATTAIVFGLSSILLFGIVGLAIDSSKVYNAKTKMMVALEASALAAAKLLDADEDASNSEIQDYAKTFFDQQVANFQLDDASFSNFRAEIDRNNSKVATRVDMSMGSMFGRVVDGDDSIAFTPEAVVSYKARKIEVVLVLDVTGSMDHPGKLDSLKQAAKDFVDGLYASNPERNAVRIAMVPYSGSVNAGSYASELSGGFSSDGCVVERSGPEAFTNAAPTFGNAMNTSSSVEKPVYNCTEAEIVPLQDLSEHDDRDDFKQDIEDLTADGATAGHIGLAIGWYMLSPNWSYIWPTNPRPFDPENNIKAVILMTDGVFNLSYANGGESHVYGTPETKDPAVPGSAPNQALALCTAMQANNINAVQVYTVAFQAGSDAEAMLKTCSGEDNFFNAENSGELVDAFRSIVEKLTSLRLTG
ncbi:MAG: vWA domain-containing protein [Pseudomonadota bacterium]